MRTEQYGQTNVLRMAEEKVSGPEGSFVTEMIEQLPLRTYMKSQTCFQARFLRVWMRPLAAVTLFSIARGAFAREALRRQRSGSNRPSTSLGRWTRNGKGGRCESIWVKVKEVAIRFAVFCGQQPVGHVELKKTVGADDEGAD